MQKVVLITGTSAGLGQGLAQVFHKNGYTVYGTCRNPSQYPTTPYTTLAMDVTDEAQVKDAVQHIFSREGRLDILINNAGIGLASPTEIIGMEKVNALFQTNVMGMVLTLKYVLPIMRKQGTGKIINISSIGSEIALPYRGLYCASKAAVNKINDALRMEIREFGIQSTSILAGDMQTSINENRLTEIKQTDHPYSDAFKKVHHHINSEVSKGITALEAAEKIWNITQKNKLRPSYSIGHPMQQFSLVLKRLLPGGLFENIIAQYSGI